MLAKQPIKNGVETTHISIKGIANTGHPERMRKNISTVNGQYKIQLYNESRKDRATVSISLLKKQPYHEGNMSGARSIQ